MFCWWAVGRTQTTWLRLDSPYIIKLRGTEPGLRSLRLWHRVAAESGKDRTAALSMFASHLRRHIDIGVERLHLLEFFGPVAHGSEAVSSSGATKTTAIQELDSMGRRLKRAGVEWKGKRRDARKDIASLIGGVSQVKSRVNGNKSRTCTTFSFAVSKVGYYFSRE